MSLPSEPNYLATYQIMDRRAHDLWTEYRRGCKNNIILNTTLNIFNLCSASIGL